MLFSPPQEPIKEGMLEIKSLGIWHKRWFVLYENGILAYHKPHKVRVKPARTHTSHSTHAIAHDRTHATRN